MRPTSINTFTQRNSVLAGHRTMGLWGSVPSTGTTSFACVAAVASLFPTVCAHTQRYLYIYIHMYACMSVCMSVSLCVCMPVYVYMCMCVCVCVHACTYVCFFVSVFLCFFVCLVICLFVGWLVGWFGCLVLYGNVW